MLVRLTDDGRIFWTYREVAPGKGGAEHVHQAGWKAAMRLRLIGYKSGGGARER